MLTGTFIEKFYVLKLLAQLCFDSDLCMELIKKHNDLIEHIQDILHDSSSDDHNDTETVCENILWSLSQIHSVDDGSVYEPQHIMISFSWNLKNSCVKIQNELKKSGYSVNMNTSGSYSLEDTKKAIEEASCVLVCVCEKYRLDENCQLEARYALKLNKPLIPLVMQEGYDNLDISCWIKYNYGKFFL